MDQDQDTAACVNSQGTVPDNHGYSNDSQVQSVDQRTAADSGEEDYPHEQPQEEDYVDGELEEPDGQRSSVSLDEDGGTHFEVSQPQDTVVRRGGPPVSALAEAERCESPSGPDIPEDNDVMFDPVQRLNFDDDDEDENVDNDDEGRESSLDANTMVSYNLAEDELHQRPVVNGSEQGESARSLAFQSLHDHSQNVRIIEGHDSSFLDDASQSQQPQQQLYGFNFLHTQLIHLPPHSTSNASVMGNSGSFSPGGFPSNHHRGLGEEEQAHNLYDSLEREDGSSPFGEDPHNAVAGENSDALHQYFSSGGGGGQLSLLATSSAGPQHQFHNHQHGDNDAFWENEDSSDHGSFLSTSHSHQAAADLGGSPHHGRHQSPPRNFQVELTAAQTIPSADSVFLSSGRQGDGFNSPLEGDSGSQGEDDAENYQEENTEPLNAELSEEGLMQDAQMYAQPVTTASNLLSSAQSQNSYLGNSFQQTYNQSQRAASNYSAPQTANKARQHTDSCGLPQPPPKNLAWSQGQHQAVVEVSAEGCDSLDGPMQGDLRQAGAGSSLASKDPSQASGGAIPKKSQLQAARAQQKRRPAVQGSASSGDTQRPAGPGLRSGSQPSGRTTTGGTLNTQGGQKQTTSQRQNSAPDMTRGALTGANTTPFSTSQGRQPQGKITAVSPLASRTNSHTSLASSAGSTNSRVSGVGKESHFATSQKAYGGGNMVSATAPEGSHPAFYVPGKGHGTSSSTSHVVSSGLATLPHQQKKDTGRQNPANQQEHLKSRVLGKPQTMDNELEEKAYQSTSVYSQQGKRSGLGDQQGGKNCRNHSVQKAEVAGAASVGKQQLRYSRGNPQHQGQALRLQPPQRNLPGLSIHASVTSPPGSDGALPAGASPSGSEGSRHESVMSQMEALRKQGHRLSPLEPSHPESDIQGMEDVRNNLQNILNLGAGSFTGAQPMETASDVLLSEQPVNRELHFDTDSSSFMGPSGPGDMSEILENFPTFSSKMFSSVPPGPAWLDTSAHSLSQQSRAQQLRDSLEKETYRRKHCEEHIQKLNTKLLEVQQQLAVAVSTDKRKDIMIEQLDKQLARVVEGWKKRETEKDEFLKTLTHEKGQIEETLQTQQAMINNFETELAQTVDELKKEKERSAQTIRHLKGDMYEAEKAKASAVEELECEREKFQAMSEEWDGLKESKNELEKRAMQAHEKLAQEQERWGVKEQELNNKIAEVKDATQKVINIEKVKTEEMKKKKEASESECADFKSELKKAVLDMEQLLREKESQKVEMSIMEAKFESAQRKLEADLHSQMEKEIAEQASEFHARLDSTVEELSERHRRQVGELHQRQQRDLAQQAAAINDQRDQKEEEFRQQIADLEEKLQDMRTENSSLRQSKLKLESQRMEILTKLQLMMQSQWNEAVSLLVNTPQKKSLNGSFLSSSHSGGQLASALAVADGNTSVTSLNLLSSSMPVPGSAARSGGGDGLSGPLPHISKRAITPPHQPPEKAREAGASREAREEAHAQIDRMERVEDYLERLSQHMDIPLTRNDLHQVRTDGSVTSVSSTATNTTFASNNNSSGGSVSLPQQQHRDHGRPASNSLPLYGEDKGEGKDLSHQTRHASTASSPGQRPRPGHTQVHGFVTGQAGQRIITGGTAEAAAQPVPRLGSEPWHQAVAMRSPQQSSSWPPQASAVYEDAPSSAYHVSGQGAQLQNSNSQFHQDPHPHLQNHNHRQLPHPHPPDHRESYQSTTKVPAVSNSQHRQHQQHYPPVFTSLSSSSPPQAQGQQRQHRQQHQDQISPLRPQQQQPRDNHFSKNLKEKKTGSNINIYTPGSPTYTSSPGGYNNTSTPSPEQWPSAEVSTAAEGARSPVKKLNQRQFNYVKQTGQLNESLSPPVKQTAERDHADSASEASSSFHDPSRLQANYSQLSDRVEEHQSRQGELQHYVRMLLSKAPGSVCSEPERDAVSEHSVLESSRDLTDKLLSSLVRSREVDLDLNDTATALEVTTQLTRLQELREKEQTLRGQGGSAFHPLPPQASHSRAHQSAASVSDLFEENGVISAAGLSEISQLLLMYREQWETNPEAADQGNVAGQLVDALRGMTRSVSPEQQSKQKPDTRKTAEAKVSPRSQHTRKMKKMLNGSQSSGELSSSTNPDTSLLDRTAHSRAGGGSVTATRRKVAGNGKGSTAAAPAQHQHNHQHHPNHHTNHQHHMGDGSSKDRRSGQTSSTQYKAAGGGAKGGGGTNGPVWK